MASERQAVTEQARRWAVATIRHACGAGVIDMDETERRLEDVFGATTLVDLYTAIADLPSPRPPLVLGEND